MVGVGFARINRGPTRFPAKSQHFEPANSVTA